MRDRTHIVVGLGFGDEGKGATVDYLTRQHTDPVTIVRYNGGHQAAHNVVTPDGRQHHTFAQLGSGMFVRSTQTFLSRFMVINPISLHREAAAFAAKGGGSVYSRLHVDPECRVTTPIQRIANRCREVERGLDGGQRHGTCGVGVGETVDLSLTRPDLTVWAYELTDKVRLHFKLAAQRDYYRAQFGFDVFAGELTESAVEEMYGTGRLLHIVGDGPSFLRQLFLGHSLIFEGAHGLALHESYGFSPHTTWHDTTTQGAWKLLEEIRHEGEVTTVGVVRAYATRHGHGPFPTETRDFERPDAYNVTGEWQGAWRVGYFDGVLTRYAVETIGRVDYLAVNHLDRCHSSLSMLLCTMYELDGVVYPTIPPMSALTRWRAAKPMYVTATDDVDFLTRISDHVGIPIGLVGRGPTARDRQALRRSAA